MQTGQSEAIQLQNVANKKLIKNSDIIAGRRGCYLINDTNLHESINRNALVVREDDTIITVLTTKDSSGNEIDLVTEFNLTGVNLLAGEFIPSLTYPIYDIQLSGGSVMTY